MTFSILAFLLGISGLGLLLLVKKNRLIWQELFWLREQVAFLRQEIVGVRKQVVIAQTGELMRLRAIMPSQYGEDLLLWNFFNRKRNGFYVDVGAYDGVGFSNTYFFESLGWTGMLIEAVPAFYQSCLSSRPYSQVINATVGKVDEPKYVTLSIAEGGGGVGTLSFCGENQQQLERIKREGGIVRTIEVPLRSLNELLVDHQGDIDFVSIDVEGAEMDLLQGFDLDRFRPRVLVIEDNNNGSDPNVKNWLAAFGYEERL